MPYVRTLTNARPPAREDAEPFTLAHIREAADDNGAPGAWTTIETITLDPVDTDPAAPAYRDLTTDEGTLAAGWLSVVWEDADGSTAASPAVEFTDSAVALGPRERIERLTQASSYPELDDTDIDELLRLARRTDTDGVLPSESGWVATYDVNAAVSLGWEWKAGKAAGDFRFSTDGQAFNREQVFAHCMAMARRYSSAGSVTVGSIVVGDA